MRAPHLLRGSQSKKPPSTDPNGGFLPTSPLWDLKISSLFFRFLADCSPAGVLAVRGTHPGLTVCADSSRIIRYKPQRVSSPEPNAECDRVLDCGWISRGKKTPPVWHRRDRQSRFEDPLSWPRFIGMRDQQRFIREHLRFRNPPSERSKNHAHSISPRSHPQQRKKARRKKAGRVESSIGRSHDRRPIGERCSRRLRWLTFERSRPQRRRPRPDSVPSARRLVRRAKTRAPKFAPSHQALVRIPPGDPGSARIRSERAR